MIEAHDLDGPPLQYDARMAYGPDDLQRGDLRLPEGRGPHPVAVVLHGGCWRALHTAHHIEPFAAALTELGWATWNLEHRSVVHAGGGWPGTFRDVAAGTDHLREVAERHPLDLTRVVAIGHSSGGHLALWAAARHRLSPGRPEGSDDSIGSDDPLPIVAAVSLGGITDPWSFHQARERACDDAVIDLMGGTRDAVPGRYSQGSPAELLPLGVPQLLLHGVEDRTVPIEHVEEYAERARHRGDDVRVTTVANAGHFEVIAPGSEPWPEVESALRQFLDAHRLPTPGHRTEAR